MFSFYPQPGLRFNPTFTAIDFLKFARDVEGHAAALCEMAFAAFVRAADSSQGQYARRLNFDLLAKHGQELVAIYRLACEDNRIDAGKVGCQVNRLFWAIVGTADRLLGAETEDDWLKDWRSGLDRGGLMARLCVELALAGAARGLELQQIIDCLSRIGAAAGKVRSYHLGILREVPEAADELVGLAGDAGRLSQTLEDAAVQLSANLELELSEAR